MELTHLSHCVYHCDYHIVIVTKYRKQLFNEGMFKYFTLKLNQVGEHYPTIRFKEVNHDKDHLHFLMSIPPTVAVGKAVGIIKQNIARDLITKFPFFKEIYWGTDSVWSDGYFVSTVGVNEAMIKKYIEDQGKKDSGQTRFGFA